MLPAANDMSRAFLPHGLYKNPGPWQAEGSRRDLPLRSLPGAHPRNSGAAHSLTWLPAALCLSPALPGEAAPLPWKGAPWLGENRRGWRGREVSCEELLALQRKKGKKEGEKKERGKRE